MLRRVYGWVDRGNISVHRTFYNTHQFPTQQTPTTLSVLSYTSNTQTLHTAHYNGFEICPRHWVKLPLNPTFQTMTSC